MQRNGSPLAPPLIYRMGDFLPRLAELRNRRVFALARDVIDGDDPLEDRVVLRFDVERDLPHHLETARRVAELGIKCTMYVHTRAATYDPAVLHRIADMGHEIGFHHETLDRCRGDFARARELFLREVEVFRRDGFDVRTVCGHGESGLPHNGYSKNFDIFYRYPELEAEAGVREVYLWVRRLQATQPGRLVYVSETLRGINRFWSGLSSAAQDTTRPAMILAHPHRWHDSWVRSALALAGDLARAATNRAVGRRSYVLGYTEDRSGPQHGVAGVEGWSHRAARQPAWPTSR
jgi:hypothetical protein